MWYKNGEERQKNEMLNISVNISEAPAQCRAEDGIPLGQVGCNFYITYIFINLFVSFHFLENKEMISRLVGLFFSVGIGAASLVRRGIMTVHGFHFYTLHTGWYCGRDRKIVVILNKHHYLLEVSRLLREDITTKA